MTDKEIVDRLIQDMYCLATQWTNDAYASIPPEYTERGLGEKYLKLDNYAAALADCAEELTKLLQEAEHDYKSK